jgi:hypothetical protein
MSSTVQSTKPITITLNIYYHNSGVLGEKTELTVEDKYKRTMEEIESLKVELGIPFFNAIVPFDQNKIKTVITLPSSLQFLIYFLSLTRPMAYNNDFPLLPLYFYYQFAFKICPRHR